MVDFSFFRKLFARSYRDNLRIPERTPLFTSKQKGMILHVADIMQLPTAVDSNTNGIQNMDSTSSDFGKLAWMMDFDPLGD